MSLLVWLPMTKDLSDQGLGGCTITNSGATLDNNGKLGKCYNFDGTDDRILVSGLNQPKNITVAFWMKRNATTNTRQFMFTAWNGITLELTTTNYVHCYTYGGGGVCDSTMTVTADSGWVHVAYSFEDKVGGKLYINGVLNRTTASTGSIEWSTTSGYIGNFNTYYNGKMNDFRIYDHVLSPREIEILSRGLVAHYPLNNNGGGQPNLYDFESVASKWAVEGLTLTNATDDVYGNVLKITSPSSVSSQRIYRTVSNVWKADTKFTVSFLAKASKTAVVKMSRSLANYAPDVTVGTTWKRYSTVITCSTTVEGGTLSIQTSTASADIYLTQIKLELGDKATVYCPGVGDSHYIPLGYNSTTEYDVSGYGYNGTKTQAMSYTSDTARYSVATIFDGSLDSIKIPSLFKMLGSNGAAPYSIAVWTYKDSIGSKGYQTILGGGSGFELEARNGSGTDPQYVLWNWGKVAASYEFGKWTHVVFTKQDNVVKLYVNGVLANEGTSSTSVPDNDYWIGSWNSSSAQNFEGRMSDFRIYATALSATQVAELYNTAVSVANNGTLMGYELVEG